MIFNVQLNFLCLLCIINAWKLNPRSFAVGLGVDVVKSEKSWSSENVCFETDELRHAIRQEMENNRGCNERQKVLFLLSEGKERVKRLDETLDMQGNS